MVGVALLTTNDRKIFVLDTNVVLFDSGCIDSFRGHNVVIPITLLEELDKFKKGSAIINLHAREFSRRLDALVGDGPVHLGVELPDGGSLTVATGAAPAPELRETFWEDLPDHRILSVAFSLAREHGSERVVLVSKDINLRMKAKAVGLRAEDFETGKIGNIDELYTGKNTCEDVDGGVIDAIHSEGVVSYASAGLDLEPTPHEFFILRNRRKSILARFDSATAELRRVDSRKTSGITPRNAEQAFALDCLLAAHIPLVTLSGKAGTGKTLMALAAGLEIRRNYKQVLLARPVVPLSNKDIGFLPGDVESKLDPYMQPLFDNLDVIRAELGENKAAAAKVGELLESGKLMITPLAFIRGRSLSRVFFIVDETQNLTPHEVKTIITRAGEGTKVVFTGDPYQIDTPYLDSRSNGLTYLIDRMKGQELYAHVTLEKGERSELAELASDLL